jgi:hypothetical protein
MLKFWSDRRASFIESGYLLKKKWGAFGAFYKAPDAPEKLL